MVVHCERTARARIGVAGAVCTLLAPAGQSTKLSVALSLAAV